jgi:RNA polymerase primary sigma factor
MTGEPSDSTIDTVEHLLAQSRRWPLLSGADERALARRVERGDTQARERMILSNVRLVVSIARRYQGCGVPMADLVQEGMIGLIRAVDRFDWRPGFRFSTYGTIWIRKYVQMAVDAGERPLRVPPSLVRRARQVAATERRLTVQLGRAPNDEELAAGADITLDQLRDVRLSALPVVALDRPLDDDATTVGDLLPALGDAPDARLEARWRTGVLTAALGSLQETERQVIALRFDANRADRRTFAEIGAAIGRSPERTRQIEDRALRRLAAADDVAQLRFAA